MSNRLSFGKIKEALNPPNLIEVQLKSYEEFLQQNINSKERKIFGLELVFQEIFPIHSYDEKISLNYQFYELENPKTSSDDCLRAGETFSASLYVLFTLNDESGIKEERVYMGEMPLMTERGTFIINGAERVVVSQLHRSPGICFEMTNHLNGIILHGFRIIPDRGTWLEIQFDSNGLLYVYLDRRKRRRKFLATTFLRAIGLSKDEDIVKEFYQIHELSLKNDYSDEELSSKVLFDDILDKEKNLVAKAYEPLSIGILSKIKDTGKRIVKVIDSNEDDILIKSLKKDTTNKTDEALKEIYRRLRPNDPPTPANSKALLKRLFFDKKRYDLTSVGRYKINQKLGINVDEKECLLHKDDVITAIKYLINLKKGEGFIDDIDHLGSRRVRSAGELLLNQCRVGIARTERLAKEKITMIDQSLDTITPQKLINPKALSAVIKDFFGRSQLSQFMDQINPLSELTHKRRLSALGPGGLNRERAGFEVRDVHPSHYGRICPIETPEGPNIGLINSMASFARINEYGFIETPYRKIVNGKLTSTIDYLTADQEENHLIAQVNNQFDEKTGVFKNKTIVVRKRGDFLDVDPKNVSYMDISPKQLVSVAASLVPFLEHDDANRALMGSNMQRQAVPLLIADSPLVGTGMEKKVAIDSKSVVVANKDGIVASANAECIITSTDGKIDVTDNELLADPFKIKSDEKNNVNVYPLRKFMRSNSGTIINQTPIVKKGDKISQGDVIADGPSTDKGELALGKNLLVAFVPWNGYNFEDAITISERIVRDDVYTSIHSSVFEISARDTKLGPEEITRDIPNVSDEALKNLDRDGVIRLGAEVKPGDILVGKITPKSESELAPEERLLRAIFGEKAADVKDSSLRVTSGINGIVMDVRITSRKNPNTDKPTQSDLNRQRKIIIDEFKNKKTDIVEQLTEKLSELLLGQKLQIDILDAESGEILIQAGSKITKTLMRKLANNFNSLDIEQSTIRDKIYEITKPFEKKIEEIESDRNAQLDRIDSGGDYETGVIKQVKVYIASKRKLSVGDKMAGRHGNKGVVAKIVPVEDMPFLEDGTSVDICLNPLGVPSRMNVGQVLETHLGVAAKALGFKIASPVFDGIPESKIINYMKEAKQKDGYTWISEDGKSVLFDGRTGEKFHQKVVVGYIYMLKLNHLVADKIHARAVGPYSLVTQQPLGGKAQYGGQRFGEMEVWALEAYGAAYTLQELLTVKSDDVQGRTRIYESIVKGENTLQAGTPESFNVLVKEMQSLGLNVKLVSNDEDIAQEELQKLEEISNDNIGELTA